MKKYLYILILIFLSFQAQAHTSHYKGIKVIKMEILRNGKTIGYSNYFFKHGNNTMEVKNYTQFEVKLLGAVIFSVTSEAVENYKNDKLFYFKSITFQNNKEKYVNLNYDKSSQKLIIDGSSYKGNANPDIVIGSWWNHKILEAKKQISPLSGSIKEQVVIFIGKEEIELNGKKYTTKLFKLKSKDPNTPENKKLDFDIWYNEKNNIILKVNYSKLGEWEYKVKSFK